MWLWDYRYRVDADRHFRSWYTWAIRSRLEQVRRVARMIARCYENIATCCKHPITNGAAEGLNAAIQFVKGMARGFRNLKRFQVAICFRCGGLDLYLCDLRFHHLRIAVSPGPRVPVPGRYALEKCGQYFGKVADIVQMKKHSAPHHRINAICLYNRPDRFLLDPHTFRRYNAHRASAASAEHCVRDPYCTTGSGIVQSLARSIELGRIGR